MKILIYCQFIRNKSQWLGIAPVIFISSLIIALAINGYINIDKNIQVFAGLPDPKPIFGFPIVFGGITLFFVISTLIHMLVKMFKDDYDLLSIVGASRFQLSLLVGGQIFIISSIISLIGYICSIPVTRSYYYVLQYFFGKDILPNIPFRMTLVGGIVTVIVVSSLAFLSGCYYSFKGLNSDTDKKLKILRKIISVVILVASWLFLLLQVFTDSSVLIKAQIIFYLVIFNIPLIYQMSPYIQSSMIRGLSKIMPPNKYMHIISKWNLLYHQAYIKSISAATISVITLVSSFQMISQNILSQFQHNSDLELKVAFIVYMGAPILIVLANIISIAILSLNQEGYEIKQFQILGVSNSQMAWIKLGESLFLSIVSFITALIFNTMIFLLIVSSLSRTLLENMNYSGLFLSNVIISTILFVLLFLSKSVYFMVKASSSML